MRELPRIVADTAVGKAVSVIVLRNGEEVEIAVTLGRLEEGEKLIAAQEEADENEAEKPVEVLGMMLGEINEESRAKFELADDAEGVLIVDVVENSNAAEKQIRPGDVIQEISQEAVSTVEDVKQRIDDLKEDGRRSVLLLLMSKDNELRFVAVRIDEDDSE
jgi:serine protease Do